MNEFMLEQQQFQAIQLFFEQYQLKKGMSERTANQKPNLYVQIQEFQSRIRDFKDDHLKPDSRPLRYTKTVNDLRKINYDRENLSSIAADRKARRLNQLQFQKSSLLSSLQVLRVSAVSAIAQKQAQIQKLRQEKGYQNQQKFELYEQQLQRKQSRQIELQQQRQYLIQELKMEREKYIREIEEKQYVIDQLQEEIMQLRRQLQLFEHNDFIKNRRIRLLQDQNTMLSDKLQEFSVGKVLIEHGDYDQNAKRQTAVSVTSSLPARNVVSAIYLDHQFQSQADKAFINAKIDQMTLIHRKQLCQVREYFFDRINELRAIYQKELRLPTEQDARQRNGSVHQRQPKSMSRSSSDKVLETFSKKSLKSYCPEFALNIRERDMYAIDESIENDLDTSRSKMHDLKYQIRMKNLSECPSIGPRLFTQQDTQSQFTSKYFENPFTFVRKNKSIQEINQINQICVDQCQSPIRKQSSYIPSQEEKKEDSFWSNSLIFASGLLSGIGLTSLFFSKLQNR